MSTEFAHLTLRHHRLIAAIARHGQISTAAHHLAMTQPAASRSLAEVERILDVPIFERHPKGMTPTPVGQVVVRHANILLGGLDLATEELAAFRDGHSGTVRVGAVTGAAVGFLVPAIRELKRLSTRADIRVQVAPSVDLMDALLLGELDFVLCRVPPEVDASQLRVLRGRVEHLSLLVRAGHPHCGTANLGLDALQYHTWIVQQRGMPLREAIEQRHLLAGLRTPHDLIESSSLLLTIAYLMSSDAVSPVAHEVSELLTRTHPGALSTLDMQDRTTLSPYYLIHRKHHPMSPLATRFLALVLDRMTA